LKKVASILTIICVVFGLHSQAVDTTFMRTYGGLRYENGASCKATLDGGIILAGSTGSFGNGNSDMYLTKVDSDGTYQWSRSYGGFFTENCHAIIETADTGFLLVGYTNSFGAGQYDMYVVKTNSNGDTDWTKTFGGPAWDFAYDVMESVDGNYLVVGETYSTTSGNSDVYVLKLDLSGDTLWTKRYGGSKQDFGRSIIELYDSTIVIAGGTASMGAGGLDVLLMKLTAQGDSLWARAHGGPEDDWARDVIMTRDTGLSVIGTTESFNTDYKEMYHIKTDSSNLDMDTIMVPWAIAIETLLYSSLEGPSNSRTLFTVDKMGKFEGVLDDENTCFITAEWRDWSIRDMNQEHFQLGTNGYQVISNQE